MKGNEPSELTCFLFSLMMQKSEDYGNNFTFEFKLVDFK